MGAAATRMQPTRLVEALPSLAVICGLAMGKKRPRQGLRQLGLTGLDYEYM